MQAIPTTGIAMGVQYRELMNISLPEWKEPPVVVCSLGDASVTEGEVAEAFQMAALKQYPIIYLVQDNGWDISAKADEIRAMNAFEYAKGFPGLEAIQVDGSDFEACYKTCQHVIETVRQERRPFLIHAEVPLLNHHTSGVRMEWYRDDLEDHAKKDPYPKLIQYLIDHSICTREEISQIETSVREIVVADFDAALASEDPSPEDLYSHVFAPTPVQEEVGVRSPADHDNHVMVDCALFAVRDLLEAHKECLFYGQDVGARLGGVFREAATLAKKFGDHRVFNTPIQEAYIVGSTVGMSAVGLKPIVEVQFADYIWPGLNQLFTEVSRSCFLTIGKWPVSMILRVPIGAYGSGGPFHSSSVESVLTNIKGIKVVYPSNGADLKGLMKAAYIDPNPVVMLEHKGLYWSKSPGTATARNVEPDKDYVIPLGKARIVEVIKETDEKLPALTIISYGMGAHWAFNACKKIKNPVDIVDLRTLAPLDVETIYDSVKRTHRCLVVTEEPVDNTFAQSIAARVQENCFEYLDAPVRTIGSENLPAIPLNITLEKTMILNADKVLDAIRALVEY
jgi:2-oxoisovalerate dehydrogenase E1 component